MKRRQLAALVLIALAAACGSDSTTSPEAEVAGTYTLRTINGAPLPFTLGTAGSATFVLVSSTVTLKADGTFTGSTTATETTGSSSTTSTESGSGTWTRSGTTISLRDSVDGGITTAQYADGSLTLVDTGFTMVFRK
jgi:hypothetical protein